MLQSILEAEGYIVVPAADGIDALLQLELGGAPPDLILLDVTMPRMDAFEFRKRQLGAPKWASIPVLLIRGDGNASSKAAALCASAFLEKPVDIDVLLAAVARIATPRAA